MDVLPRDCIYECIERIPRSSLWDCSMVNRMFRELCLKRRLEVDERIDADRCHNYKLGGRKATQLDDLLLKMCREGDLLSITHLHPKFIERMKCSVKYLIALGSQAFDPQPPSGDQRSLHPPIDTSISTINSINVNQQRASNPRIKLITYLLNRFGVNIKDEMMNKYAPYDYKNHCIYLYAHIMEGACLFGNIEIIIWLNSLPITSSRDKLKTLKQISYYGTSSVIKAFCQSGVIPNEDCQQVFIRRKEFKLFSELASDGVITYNLLLKRRDIYKLIDLSLDHEPISITYKWIAGTDHQVSVLNMAALDGNLRVVKTMFEYGLKMDKLVVNRANNKKHLHLLDFIDTWRLEHLNN